MEKSINDWDGFLGSNFLKVDEVEDEDQVFICKVVEVSDDNRPRLILENNNRTHTYDLNVTDAKFCYEKKIAKPNDIIGKKICFRKTQAFSPTAKKDVPTLRISKIE